MVFKKTTKEKKHTVKFLDGKDANRRIRFQDDPRGKETIERAIKEILENPRLMGFNMVAIIDKDNDDPEDFNILDVGGGVLNPLQQIALAKRLQDAAERAMEDTHELLKHIEEKIAKMKEEE